MAKGMKIADVEVGETYLAEIRWGLKAAVKISEKGLPHGRSTVTRKQNVGCKGEILATYGNAYTQNPPKVGDVVEFPARDIEAVYGPWKAQFDEREANKKAAQEKIDTIRDRMIALRLPNEDVRFGGQHAAGKLDVTLPAEVVEDLLSRVDGLRRAATAARAYFREFDHLIGDQDYPERAALREALYPGRTFEQERDERRGVAK